MLRPRALLCPGRPARPGRCARRGLQRLRPGASPASSREAEARLTPKGRDRRAGCRGASAGPGGRTGEAGGEEGQAEGRVIGMNPQPDSGKGKGTTEPVPPWEMPGSFRRDYEPHRGPLLL
jgi:hypothetical protein